MKRKNNLLFTLTSACCIVAVILLPACTGPKKSTADYLYFQYGPNQVNTLMQETTIRPNDLIGIQVYSKTSNQDQTTIFNIPSAGGGGSSSSGGSSSGGGSTGGGGGGAAAQGYQVSLAGNIDFPIIGSILVAGLSKYQLQTLLTQKITPYVKNPVVVVRFLQFNINVLGEVRSPGTKNFTTDKVTIIDAIGAAGDITDAGRREDVTIIREEEGKKVFHSVDMRSRAIFESPVFVLQPNDIVYVKPNEYKLRSLNVDPDIQRKTGLFTTALGIVITLATLIVTVLR